MVGCGCWLWLRGDWVLGVGGVVLGAWLVWVLVVVWCLFFERNARSVSQHTNLAEVWPSASLHNTVVLPTDLEPPAPGQQKTSTQLETRGFPGEFAPAPASKKQARNLNA